MLSERVKKLILALQDQYPEKRSALIPALHVAQAEKGYLSIETQKEVALLFDLAPNEVHSVVTFYDMFYEIQGEPYFLNPASLKQYDSETQQVSLANYPYEWASDLSQVATGGLGQLYIYPQSAQNITITHRYYLRQNPITTPETSAIIPWFSDQDYLIEATAMRMMRITDDSRYNAWVQMCDKMLESHLLTEGDEQQVVKEVQLDPRRFRIGGSNRPTKLDPW